MNKQKYNHLLEYLSTGLILSYFFIHKIIIVLIGIIISFYLININLINKFIRSIKQELKILEVEKNLSGNNSSTKIESDIYKSDKNDSKLTLVEEIEELGYIPSLDNKKNNKAA